MNTVPRLLETYLSQKVEVTAAMKKAFVQAEEELVAQRDIDSECSGTTAVAVLIRGDQMWVENAGDSRAVIGSTIDEVGTEGTDGRLVAIELTEDQKPNSPIEATRIFNMGGYVSPEKKHESSRVYVKKDGAGGLALARAIGDTSVGLVGVIAEPVVKTHTLTSSDKCIILASDGVWEYIESQEAVEIVTQHASASRGANALLHESMDKWKITGLYRDDITIGVFYPPLWG